MRQDASDCSGTQWNMPVESNFRGSAPGSCWGSVGRTGPEDGGISASFSDVGLDGLKNSHTLRINVELFISTFTRAS